MCKLKYLKELEQAPQDEINNHHKAEKFSSPSSAYEIPKINNEVLYWKTMYTACKAFLQAHEGIFTKKSNFQALIKLRKITRI